MIFFKLSFDNKSNFQSSFDNYNLSTDKFKYQQIKFITFKLSFNNYNLSTDKLNYNLSLDN